MPDGSVLNRFWDDEDTPRDESYREDTELARTSGRPAPQLFRDIRAAAESGWDFGSRWFADGHTRATMDTTEIVPVDLNSLLFGLENAIRAGCARSGDDGVRARVRAAGRRAAQGRRPLSLGCLAGAYLDYRWTRRTRACRRFPRRRSTLCSCPLASKPRRLRWRKSPRANCSSPAASSQHGSRTGQQWDSPNGWAPLQWIAVSGLRDYGQAPLAATIACRWMANVNDVYRQSGKLVEKYDVVDTGRSGGGGEYPLQDGFGWTNGVMRKLIALYPADSELPRSPAMLPGPDRVRYSSSGPTSAQS